MFQLELLPLEDHHSQQCNKKWKGQVKKKMTRRNGKRSITADVMEEKKWEMTLVYLFLPRDEQFISQ